MTDFQTLVQKSAATIGRVLASGSVDPVELTRYVLQRAEASKADSVFLSTTPERALSEAKASARRLAQNRPLSPLDGVPISLKDLIDLEGEVTTAASALYRDAPAAKRDAIVAQNLSAAGMICIGKVNLTEFAYSGIGLNPHFGTAINPLSPDVPRAPGGSSSGTAVSISSGIVPCSIGSDTGGSVRIPASFNGLVGYKSSEGRISTQGVFALSRMFDTMGPLARSVEDCVLLDAAMRGQAGPAVQRAGIKGLTIIVPDTVVMDDLAPAVARNYEATLNRLEQAGAVLQRRPLHPFAEVIRLTAEYGSLVAADAYVEHRGIVESADRAQVDRRVMARILGGKSMSAADVVTLQRARRKLQGWIRDTVGEALIAMPTTAITAPEIAPLEADDELFHKTNMLVLRNTSLGNFLDLPGLALPNGQDENGMPTSILFSAVSGRDDALLGYGFQLEQVARG
ncbi:glutamyl-tRNA(Gln) amidotransferase subunit A (Glu-ADTsubunit A) [Rhodobacteraceae bacterium KLH11]|nr:glutamyl-tRNA(Gln) amidotransferase subunit A (Glu-ADTsubunit A) [Rhodobacteraceae bacterium KLH11]